MKSVVVVLALLAQDPADQLRRQELMLRLDELASSGRTEALAKAVLRELRGRAIEGTPYEVCWKSVGLRRWDGKLEEFLAAWDKAAAAEPPAPAQALFRARLESLQAKPPRYREMLEAAGKKHRGEPALLWHLAKARFDAADHAGAASALEEMAPLPGFSPDLEEFHRMLAVSYAETGRRAAAIERLRALREDRIDLADLATLSLKCRIPEEAARFYALAIAEEPDRLSLRMGLIRALQEGGEPLAAAAQRREMFSSNGKIVPGKVEDYFFLLPGEGRSDEIVRSLREIFSAAEDSAAAVKLFDSLVVSVPSEDRMSVAAAWEKSAADARSWVILGHMKRGWGNKLDQMIDTFEKGEKQYPGDPAFAREMIEPLVRLSRFIEAAAAYRRLADLDPEARRTGPRPWSSVNAILAGLVERKDPAAALRLGVVALSEKSADAATRAAVRAAMKPACDAAGNEFWAEMRKLKIPPAEGKAAEAIALQLSKLGDDEFAVRADASRELQKAGLPAIPALLERIDDPDAEIRSRAREIIRAILSE
jgi:tetratricopeptide (TPR) repeat protein